MFKLIKTTNWETATGTKGTSLTLAYKGRVYNVNQADFEHIKIDGTNVTLGEKVEQIMEEYHDKAGTLCKGLRLKPVNDLDFARNNC